MNTSKAATTNIPNQKRPARVLCAGVPFGANNVGDEAIITGVVRMIREVSKKETQGLAEGLRVVEERQAKEIEFFLQACALRLETGL